MIKKHLKDALWIVTENGYPVLRDSSGHEIKGVIKCEILSEEGSMNSAKIELIVNLGTMQELQDNNPTKASGLSISGRELVSFLQKDKG